MASHSESSTVNRRDALRAITAGIGAAASAVWVTDLIALAEQHAVHAHLLATTPQAGAWTPAVLSPQQFETVGTLVELIIPATDTPGAKAALVDRYVDGVLSTASAATRDRFLDGLAWLDAHSRTLFGAPFNEATAAQQVDLLARLSVDGSQEDAAGVQFFSAIKSMTITGYYTTEIGLRQELGNDGVLFLPAFVGCTHPEHQA